MAGLHTPSISLLYPSVPCAEQAELGEVPGVRQRTYGACNVHGLKDICLHQISALENKGTAWTLFITCLLCGTVLKCGIHLDLWADPCSKGCGSLDVDGWPDVGRTDILVGSEEGAAVEGGGVGYIGIWHCSNSGGSGTSLRKLGIRPVTLYSKERGEDDFVAWLSYPVFVPSSQTA